MSVVCTLGKHDVFVACRGCRAQASAPTKCNTAAQSAEVGFRVTVIGGEACFPKPLTLNPKAEAAHLREPLVEVCAVHSRQESNGQEDGGHHSQHLRQRNGSTEAAETLGPLKCWQSNKKVMGRKLVDTTANIW